MNGTVRPADVTTGVLACTTAAFLALVVVHLLAPPNSAAFSYSAASAKSFIAIAIGAFIVFIAAAAARRLRSQLALPITTHLSAVVAVLATYEAIYFAVIAPKVIAETSMPLASELAIEIVPVSLLAGIAWGSMTLKRRGALIITAMVLCVIGLAITSPALLYGVAEQIGWLPRPARHLSGVHTLPLPRHLSYIVLAALAGLPFASPARRDT